MTTLCREIADYIAVVRSGCYPVCKYQIQLCDMVERIFDSEDLTVNEEQLATYLSYQKYFPFQLFPWELFCFALHNCVYRTDGSLRFPILVIYVGRGAGKNGYLGFEDFCLLTAANGVPEYHIDIFATSEDQAKQSFTDVWNMLNANEAKAGGARIVGTGRSDYPNQINNVLIFPGLFKGALAARTKITEEIKLAGAHALAEMIPDDELNEENLIPYAFDPRLADTIAQAVIRTAQAGI